MKAGLNKIKIAIISMIVLAMAIGQLELFGKVYAEELEKIKEQDPMENIMMKISIMFIRHLHK